MLTQCLQCNNTGDGKQQIYLHEHGDSHGTDSPWYWSDEGCLLFGSSKVNITYNPLSTWLGAVCEKIKTFFVLM